MNLSDPSPFAGTIKMINTYDENGKCTIKWEQVDMSKHASGNLGIADGTMTLDCSEPLRMGTERMRIADDGVYIRSNQEPAAFEFKQPGEVWARVDKDSNVTHLDMDLCAKGPQNAYTALAIAIWNKAVETAAEDFELEDDYYRDEVRDSILRNKK